MGKRWYLDQSMRDQGTPTQNKPIINQSTQSICNSISLLQLNNLKDSHTHREKLWIHLCCLYFVKWRLECFFLLAKGILVKIIMSPPLYEKNTTKTTCPTGNAPWRSLDVFVCPSGVSTNIWFKIFLIPQRFKVRNQPLLQNNNNSSNNNIKEKYVNN